jgi:regulation of enolase protein 1 (concanavalin A-like superfamily)
MTETNAPGTLVRDIPWNQGNWRNAPVSVAETSTGRLRVEAVQGSDAWQRTSYGFQRDSEHGLLRPFELDTAVEVEFVADMSQQFDQAGVVVRVDEDHWVKAGTEFADGVLRLSTVVTDVYSDWSTAPVPHWQDRKVTIRASWAAGALSVRAKAEGEEFELIRLAPWSPHENAMVVAGPYLCAPERGGFTAEFTGWKVGPRDAALH